MTTQCRTYRAGAATTHEYVLRRICNTHTIRTLYRYRKYVIHNYKLLYNMWRVLNTYRLRTTYWYNNVNVYCHVLVHCTTTRNPYVRSNIACKRIFHVRLRGLWLFCFSGKMRICRNLRDVYNSRTGRTVLCHVFSYASATTTTTIF